MAALEGDRPREGYVGQSIKQIREGYGVYYYENQFFKYEGEWKKGKKHGHGKLSMADGSFYEGEFKDGEIEGHGVRLFNNGNQYSGQFFMGEMHGQGIMKYINGTIYEGMWFRNKRQGYGIYKLPDNSSYQGYLHNNLRHGEGTQVFGNGDRYDGDWVNDKRQGHGSLKCRDGTSYEGQWRNDLFNGQGTFIHSSGMIYEGQWVNGRPASMAAKLAITVPEIEVTQGYKVQITVEVHTEDGEPVKQDQGRVLEIMALFRDVKPKPVSKKESKRESQIEGLVSGQSSDLSVVGASNIFTLTDRDVYETPFDYNAIPYPLTDQMADIEELGPLPEASFDQSLGSRQTTLDAPQEKEEAPAAPTPAPPSEGETKPGERLETPAEEAASPDKLEEEEVFPPVNPQRTEGGSITFENLMLCKPPRQYPPFVILDEEAQAERNKSFAKQGRRLSLKEKQADTLEVAVKEDDMKQRQKREGDFRFARPGEYLIMVRDITSPPFMNVTLQPAFGKVTIMAKKKEKKPPKKEKAPVNADEEEVVTMSADTSLTESAFDFSKPTSRESRDKTFVVEESSTHSPEL